MIFFNKAVSNGATFLGTGLTILGISFALEFVEWKALLFAIAGGIYIIASVVAFFCPVLSGEKRRKKLNKKS